MPTPSDKYCDPAIPIYVYNGQLYICSNGSPVQVSAAAGGTAGGALAGTYPNPTLAVPQAMVQIAQSVVVGSTTTNITFSSIPATYSSLMIKAFGQTNAGASDNLLMQFNDDTGANYSYSLIYGGFATLAAGAATAQTAMPIAGFAGTDSTLANQADISIVGYASTAFFKTATCVNGRNAYGHSGSYDVITTVGAWLNTAAITKIKLYPQVGTDLVAGSIFTLYGLL